MGQAKEINSKRLILKLVHMFTWVKVKSVKSQLCVQLDRAAIEGGKGEKTILLVQRLHTYLHNFLKVTNFGYILNQKIYI